MADVQIDDGNFTQIANVLLERIASAKLNGCQHAIILILIRYTYGFKRKEHDLSAGFLEKATGYNKRQIQRDLKILTKRNIVHQRVVNGLSRTLRFNKDYESWTTYGELADGESTDGEKADGGLADGGLADIPTANLPEVTYGELADQEINSFKQNPKQISSSAHETVNEVFTRVTRQLTINGLYGPYFAKIYKKGYTEEFVKELLLEMGECADKPNYRYFETIAEEWMAKGIYTRLEAKRRKELQVIQGDGQGGKYEGRAQGNQYGRYSGQNRSPSISDAELDAIQSAQRGVY